MDGEYVSDEYSQFQRAFKKVLKKYRNTFEDDYSAALQVLLRRLPQISGDGRKIPKTRAIEGLGEGIKMEIFKMHVNIEQARSDTGRLIFLVDRERKLVFLIDVYHKNERENHDSALIKVAYAEFIQKYPRIVAK